MPHFRRWRTRYRVIVAKIIRARCELYGVPSATPTIFLLGKKPL